MNPQRQLIVRLAMLNTLADCNGYLLNEAQLFAQLNLAVVPPVTVSEFEAELRWLDAEHLVAGIQSELGGAKKWKITDAGKLVRISA